MQRLVLPSLNALTFYFLSLCLDCRFDVFSSSCVVTMSTISPTDFDSLEIQQQYNDINNRWDLAAETDWDNENSSARLFERSRIKALAGMRSCRRVIMYSLTDGPGLLSVVIVGDVTHAAQCVFLK